MRINNVGPLIVTPAEPRTEVGNTRAIDAVRAYSPDERRPETPVPVLAQEEPAVPPEEPPGERRQRDDRRGEDRRRRQVPVLIDTRVADRRASARRTEDDAPGHIDVEA